MKSLNIESRNLTTSQRQELMKQVVAIENIRCDDRLSTSMREIKMELMQAEIKASHLRFLQSKEEEFQKAMQDAVAGLKHKRVVSEVREKKRTDGSSKSAIKLTHARQNFFYERDENNVNLFKYTDYANDIVMTDILRHMLVVDRQPEHRLTLLNNSNMDRVSRSMRHLLNDVENEMDNIQREKNKYLRVTGISAEDPREDKKHFKRVLKRSRIKDALMSKSAPPRPQEARMSKPQKKEKLNEQK